jgi:hypothetical protein
MTSLSRVRAVLTGWQGGPGVSTFYTTDPVAFLPALRAFYDAIKAALPSEVSVSFPGTGDIIEDTTGALTSTWTATAPGGVVGAGAGNYSAPTGATAQWNTGAVIGGHRLVGRTFLVPLASSAMASDGTLGTGILTPFATAAAALVAAGGGTIFRVWHRPRVNHPTLPDTQGNNAVVVSGTMRDIAAVLTSRRD